MPHGRKTTEELIAEEEKKAGQVKARMAELKARQRVEDRKRDNHRKIVVGAAAMAHIRIDPLFRKQLRDALNKAVTDPKHRAVIPDLLDEKAFLQAMRAAAKKAAAEAREAADAAGAKKAAAEAKEAADAVGAQQAAGGSNEGAAAQLGKGGPQGQVPPPV
jgi:septal ring factor EnvC (AmiA/AmiB activator)